MEKEDGVFIDMTIPSWAIAIVFPLSILVGWLVTAYIEAPMQKWLLKKLVSPNPNNTGACTNLDNNDNGGAPGSAGMGSVSGYNELAGEQALPGAMQQLQQEHQQERQEMEMTPFGTTTEGTGAVPDTEDVRISSY